MPSHDWGSTDFDWKSLSKAMEFIRVFNKLAINPIMMKEKWGTIRYEWVGLYTKDTFRFRLSLLLATLLYPSVKEEIVEDAPGLIDATPKVPWFAKFALKKNPWKKSGQNDE